MDAAGVMAGLTRETTIKRDRFGRWSQDGILLEHPLLVSAFNSWVDVAEDGRFCLKNDINWAYVTIEGAPVFVRAARMVGGAGATRDRVMLELSDGRSEELVIPSLRQSEEGVLYCDVRDGRLSAQFDNHAAQGLADAIHEDPHGVYIQIGDNRVYPPVVKDPLATRGSG